LGVKKSKISGHKGKIAAGVQNVLGSKNAISQTLSTPSPKGRNKRKPIIQWRFPVDNSDLNHVKLGRPARECLPEYDEMLIAHMACGYSYYSFGARVYASKEVLDRWVEKYEHFHSAKKIGHVFCLFFWEKQGIEGLPKGKDFNTGTWVFNMANRFGWKHVQAVVNDKGEPLPINPFEMLADVLARDNKMKQTLATLLAQNKIEISAKEEPAAALRPTNGSNGSNGSNGKDAHL
jgi:hypothetical protein